jgi:D-alanyl-D-alanine carboxypeptidase (penicillin-binding protein 5/6)
VTDRLLFALILNIALGWNGVFQINNKIRGFKVISCLTIALFVGTILSFNLVAATSVNASPISTAPVKTVALKPDSAAGQPIISSETAILMVAGTKQILFEKDSHKIMYPASTTKIMTLITALKRGNLKDSVVVGPGAVGIEGSSLDLRLLDRLSLKELLFGLMLASGNDAAHAVAEHVGGGSYKKFIDWMNEETEKIGALRTHYSNPHGLPDPVNHFTTAYDLALIADAGFKIDGFEKFVSTPYHTVAFQNRTRGVSLVNTNKLLMSYPGANGVKTGVTRAAGRCLVASARRGDLVLIAVVLNGGANRFKDSAALLDYGFRRLAK